MEKFRLEEVLTGWNPWWKGKGQDSITREGYVEEIRSWLGKGKAISIYGIRRCGKTTIAKQVIHKSISSGKKAEECCYVNLEDERIYSETSDPKIIDDIYRTFLSMKNPASRALLVLDEIQNVEGWERWIRRMLEQKEEADFVITGSSAALLSGDLATVLTGRTIPIEVRPLSFREFLAFNGVEAPRISDLKKDRLNLKEHEFQKQLRRYIEIGGMPELVLEPSKEKRRQIAKSYVAGILFRDVVKRYSIKESKVLEEVALYCLSNSSDYISYNKLANSLRASINTVKQYIDYLEKAYLIKIVPQFSYSVKTQQHADRIRKVYCTDNGIRNLVSFRFSQDLGRMAENTAFINISKGERMFTWKEHKEVDMVRMSGKRLEAINICFGQVKDREFEGLKEFKKRYKEAKLTLLTMDEFGERDGISMIPLWLYLLSAH